MKKWKCHDCESTFYDPDTVLYRAGRIGNGSENWEKAEYDSVCPVCGSDEIYEAYFCADCEKEVDEGELCAECSAKAAAKDYAITMPEDKPNNIPKQIRRRTGRLTRKRLRELIKKKKKRGIVWE